MTTRVEAPAGDSQVARFFKYHLPVILYAALILVVSSVPNLKTPLVRMPGGDKAVHFLEYGILALLTFRSVRHWRAGMTLRQTAFSAMVLVAIFPVIDEFLQSFIPGRSPEIYDLVADICGAWSFLGGMVWYYRRSFPSKW
jgi:VanZ family protein